MRLTRQTRRPCVLALLALLFVSLCAFGAPGTKIRTAAEPVKDRYIVQLSPFTANVDKAAQDLARQYDGRVLTVWKHALKGFWVEMAAEDAVRLAADARVLAIEEDAPVESSAAGVQPTGTGSGLSQPPRPPNDLSKGPADGDPLWHLTRISHRPRFPIGSDPDFYRYRYSNDGSHGGKQVQVYLIDLGLHKNHQEFTGRDIRGENMVSLHADYKRDPAFGPQPIADPIPPNPALNGEPCAIDTTGRLQPHGTACGSMIVGNNVGVAKGVELVSLNVSSCVLSDPVNPGRVSTAVLISALDHVKANATLPAVVSMSTFRGVQAFGPSLTEVCATGDAACVVGDQLVILESAFRNVIDAGVPIVASANNQNADACRTTPARLSTRAFLRDTNNRPGRVITVGGIGPSDERWGTRGDDDPPKAAGAMGSNYGQCVDIFAPATHLNLALPTSFTAYSTQHYGTSYAAPIVAGVVARLLAEHPDLYAVPNATATKVWERLQVNATRLKADMGLASPNLLVYIGNVTFEKQPQSMKVLETDAVRLSVSVYQPDVTYEWFAGEAGDTRTPLPNAEPGKTTLDTDTNPAVLAFTADADEQLKNAKSRKYWVRVRRNDLPCTTDCGGSTRPYYGDSNAAEVEIVASSCALPGISKQPETQWLKGDHATSLHATLQAAGGTSYYRWRRLDPDVFVGNAVAVTATGPVSVSLPVPVSGEDPIPPVVSGPNGEKDVRTYQLWLCATPDCVGSCIAKSDTAQVRTCRAVEPARIGITGGSDLRWDAPGSESRLEWNRDGAQQVRWLYRRTQSEPRKPLRIDLLTPEQVNANGGMSWVTFTQRFIYPPMPGFYSLAGGTACDSGESLAEIDVKTTCQFNVEGMDSVTQKAKTTAKWDSDPPVVVPYDRPVTLTVLTLRPPSNQSAPPDLEYRWNGGAPVRSASFTTPPIKALSTFEVVITDRRANCSRTIRFKLAPDQIPPTCDPPALSMTGGFCETFTANPVLTISKFGIVPLRPKFYSTADGTEVPLDRLNEYDYKWTVTEGGQSRVVLEGRGVQYITYQHTVAQDGTVKLEATKRNGSLVCPMGAITYTFAARPSSCTAPCAVSCGKRRPVRSQGQPVAKLISFIPGDRITFNAPEEQPGYTYTWYEKVDAATNVIGTAGSIDLVLQVPSEYWVVTRTATGSEESEHVITVLDTGSSNDVVITPTYQSIIAGQSATIEVDFLRGADGTTQYEWRRGSAYDTAQPVIGRSRKLTLYSLMDDDTFWCRIIHQNQIFDSDVAMVSVGCTSYVGGSIQPHPAYVARGQRPRLIAVGFGKLLSFNWTRSLPNDPTPVPAGGPWNVIYPEITAPVTHFSADAVDACGVSGSFGTQTIYLCVPTINQQPQANTIVPPGTAVTLTVAATPAVDGQPLSVKWYRTSDVYATTPLGEGWSFTTTLPAGTTSDSFYAVITANCGDTTYPLKSAPATIEYCAYPILHQTSGDLWITRAGQWARLWMNVEGTALTYQWYYGASGDTSTPLSGKTESFMDVSPSTTTKYWCRITSKGVCVTDTPTLTVKVCRAPEITVQPQSQRTFANGTVKLSVTASAGTNTEPLKYQWQQETSPGTWTNIAGATASSYTTPPVNGATQYQVEVSAGECRTLSQPATVELCTFPAVVDASPAETLIASGGSATLSLPPLTPVVEKSVTWYRGVSGDKSTPLGSGINISLATGPLTATTSYWAEFEYQGCVSRTTTYTVKVCVPTITQQPVGGQYITGDAGRTLSVATDVQATWYEWYQGVGDPTTWTAVPNSNKASITVNPTVDTKYVAGVKGCGSTVTYSATALVTVCTRPSISSRTPDHWVTQGTTLDIRVDAAGSSLTYQWYIGNPGDTANPTGLNQSWLRITPSSKTTYWVKVTNACGTVHSQAITISVCAAPSVTVTPATRTIFAGQTASFTASATVATNTPLSYQWYSGPPSSATLIQGATAATYTTPALSSPATYYVRVTSGTCFTDATANVAICSYPQQIHGTEDKKIQSGATTRLDLVISPVPTAYRWYRGLTGDTSAPLTGWTGTRYIDVNPTATTYYWAEVQGPDCTSQTRSIKVEVCVPKITTQPASGWVTPNGTKTLTVAADLPGVTYQWYSGTPGSGTPISGATSSSYTTPPLTAAATYSVRVTGSCGVSTDSATATISICQPPNINGHPGSTSIRLGSSSRLFVTATGNDLTYQWYQGTSGSGTALSGKTASFIDVAPQTTTNYWVQVNGLCGTQNSSTGTVAVCDTPVIQAQPANTVIYPGQSASFAVTASQPTGSPLEYQWFNAATGQAIAGANGPYYATPALTADSSYFVRVSSGGMVCVTDSAVATATVCPYTEVTTALEDKKSTPGQVVRLAVLVSPAAAEHRWFEGVSGDRSKPITGWMTVNYLDVNPTVTTRYWADFRNATCTARTNTATVNVCIPTITQQPASQYVSSGGAATLSVATNLPGATFQWYQGTTGSGTPISGQTGPSLNTGAVYANTSYWVRVSGSCGVYADSATATITICEPPSIVYPPYAGGTGIAGRAAGTEVTANGSNLTYQWYFGESGDTSRPIAGQTTRSMSVTIWQTEKVWVRIAGTCGAVNSSAVFLSVYPSIYEQPGDAVLEPGQTYSFQVVASGTYLRYEWYDGSDLIPGATGSTYTTPPLYEPKMYRVLVYSGNRAVWSREAYVNYPE